MRPGLYDDIHPSPPLVRHESSPFTAASRCVHRQPEGESIMGTTYTCDFCGEPIGAFRETVSMHTFGGDLDYETFHRNPCWGFIKEAVEAACRNGDAVPGPASKPGAVPGPASKPATRKERHEVWGASPEAVQRRAVLEAIGDGRRNWRQIAERVTAQRDDWLVEYPFDLALHLDKLRELGEIQREIVPNYNGGRQLKWIYFRNVDLRGPIGDLEQAFNEPGAS
jgi:hypothetical protein